MAALVDFLNQGPDTAGETNSSIVHLREGRGKELPRSTGQIRRGVSRVQTEIAQRLEHAELVRDGKDLYYSLFVSFPDASLGATIEIPTLEGKVKIKIDPGTQGGKILRLKSKGVPEVNSYRRGDQLVHINIWTPKALSREERELLEKLQSSPNFKPNPGKNEKSFFERMKEYFE